MNIVFFLSLLTISFGHFHFEIEPIDLTTTNLDVRNLTFDNLKDHFKNRSSGTFKSYYWEMSGWFNSSSPKMILYICGEGPCKFPSEKTLPVMAAEKVKAGVVALEHRFYGKSQPTADWSLKSLKLLTFQQGLADIAYFIETKNKEFMNEYGKVAKWVVIGGSYAGAMSAWFRYKYPHLAIGSISSSGVVNAIDEFSGYEKQVVEDIKKCEFNDSVKLLRNQQEYVDEMLYGSKQDELDGFLKDLGAEGMTRIDFPYYFADIPVTWIQKGKRNELCNILAEFKNNGTDVRNQTKEMAREARKLGHTPDSYRMDKLRNETIDHESNSRQWYYQVCTTFGWFQIPCEGDPIRSDHMNKTYWEVYCKEMFLGAKLYPNVNNTNLMMSGLGIENFASNTFFTQGSEDGWKNAGLLGNYSNDRITVREMICETCAHCSDLKSTEERKDPAIKEVRDEEIETIARWLS